DNGHDVRIWTHRQEQADTINQTHQNPKYLDVELPKSIVAYHDLERALKGVDAIIMVVPSNAIREVCVQMRDMVPEHATIAHASKGVEPETHKRLSEIIVEEIPQYDKDDIVILSGPSH